MLLFVVKVPNMDVKNSVLELKEINFTKDLEIECSSKSSGYLEIQILGRKTFFPWFSVSPLSN